MDRLPFELLTLIVYFIGTETSLPTHRSALASLSRANKTFYSIATSSLYLHVVLTRENRVEQWGKFYASKLNPWNLKDAMNELKDLVVPSSITFIPSQDDDLDLSTQQIFPRERPPVDPLLAVSTPLTSFFFRNLTSFVVSNGFTLDPNFVATVFAPTRSICVNLIRLDLSGNGLEEAVSFILGTFVRFDFVFEDFDIDWEAFEEREDARDAYWDRYFDPKYPEEEEPEWLWDNDFFETERDRLLSRASFDFDSFRRLYVTDIDNMSLEEIRNLVPSHYPFSNLTSLTLFNPSFIHFCLLFYQPHDLHQLEYLKLHGTYCGLSEVAGWGPLWRLSITKYEGVILAPLDATTLAGLVDDDGLPLVLKPVSREETAILDRYRHTGPDLRIFDLLDLRIV